MKLYPTTNASQGKWLFFIGIGLIAIVVFANMDKLKGWMGAGKTEDPEEEE